MTVPQASPDDPQRLIADLQRQLAERTAERDALADVLQVINASPGDRTPVFDAILEKATVLGKAAFGLFCTYDGALFHAVAWRGDFSTEITDLLKQPIAHRPGGPLDGIERGERWVHIADVTAEPSYQAYRSGGGRGVPFVELAGGRTGLWLPLRHDDRLRGSFVIFRREVRPFTDAEIALLQGFAAQAVIAIENARLITETREALEQQTATAEVLGGINASPGDLAPVFEAMLERATSLCEATFGILWTFDGECYRAAAFLNVPPAYVEFLREPPPAGPETTLGRITAGATVVQISDMAAHEILSLGSPLFRQAVKLGGFRSV